jgi:hypothetical protein
MGYQDIHDLIGWIEVEVYNLYDHEEQPREDPTFAIAFKNREGRLTVFLYGKDRLKTIIQSIVSQAKELGVTA